MLGHEIQIEGPQSGVFGVLIRGDNRQDTISEFTPTETKPIIGGVGLILSQCSDFKHEDRRENCEGKPDQFEFRSGNRMHGKPHERIPDVVLGHRHGRPV